MLIDAVESVKTVDEINFFFINKLAALKDS